MPEPNDAIGSNTGSGVDTRRTGAAVSRDCGMLGIGAAYGDSGGAAGVGPLPEPFANGGGSVDPFDGPNDGPCAALPFAPAADSQPFAVLTSDDRSGPVPVNVAAGDGEAAMSGTGVAGADSGMLASLPLALPGRAAARGISAWPGFGWLRGSSSGLS